MSLYLDLLEKTLIDGVYRPFDPRNGFQPEFQKPGILTPQQWLDGADLSAARAESLQYVVDNLTLATVNEARKELLESLK